MDVRDAGLDIQVYLNVAVNNDGSIMQSLKIIISYRGCKKEKKGGGINDHTISGAIYTSTKSLPAWPSIHDSYCSTKYKML